MAVDDSRLEKIEDLLRQQQKMNQRTGPFVDLDNPLASLRTGLNNAASGAERLAKSVTENFDVWRYLSKSGSNFSNDLIGMSAAAAGTRMELGDFADVIKENGKNFTGLGGNVTRGSEAFAKLSKGFFDSGLDQRFREMGYTTKDMNEMLALQVSLTKSTARMTEAGQQRSREAAAALANEFDLTTKLMGKSREQQMEEQKARARDAQVEAKIRLQTRGMSEKDAEAYRQQVNAALKSATDMGAGEAAKEMFVSGTVYTEKAAMQLSLMQGQVKAHFAELDAINRKDEQGIKSARERAKAEAVKLGDNPAYLQTVALSEAIGGPLQSAVEKQVQSTDAMYHGAKATADQMGVVAKSLSDYNTVIQKMTKDIERANLGRDVRNVDVSGLTRGVIAIEKGGQELKTGMFRIAEAVDEEGKGIATSIRNLGNAIDMGVREISGPGGSLGAKLGEAARRSLQPEKVVRKPGESDLEFEKRQEEATGGIVGSFSKSLKEITTKGDELIVSAVKGVSETISSVGGLRGITAPEPGTEPKSRRTGSPGMANALIEDWGKGTLAMLHGKEAVLTEDQLLNLTKGVQVNSLEGAVKQMSNIVPKDVQRQAGVDIEKLFGQVQTTISNAQKSPPNVENLLGDFMAGPMFGKMQTLQQPLPPINTADTTELISNVKKDVLKQGEEWRSTILKEGLAAQKQLLAAGNQKSATETITGGGSTLRQVVDTPNKIKLEKEQDALLEQYRLNRKAIAEKIKQETGLKGKTLFEAMEASPEALALKEKFEKENDKISKKILNERTAIVETTVDSKTLAKKNLAADIKQQEEQRKKVEGLENTANIRIGEIKKLMDRGMSQADAQRQVETDAAKKAKADIPKTSFVGADGKINLDAISFGDGNKPIIRDIKAKAAETSEAIKPKEEEAKKQAEESAKKATAQATTTKPKEETTSATKATGKAATLDDVVSSLNSLNSKMSQLLSQSQELGSRQISATKSNSQNLYVR